MRGHIAKKGKRYYAVIYEGIDPATGKERHRWHAAGSTRKESERLLADLVKRQHDGDYRPPEKITLGEYLERWLPTQRQPLAASSYSSYQRNIRLHVLPHIGSIPIQRLTPEDLDDLYAMLLANGRRNKGGGPLNAKTVRHVHAVIHKALADAHRKGSVARNVADLADPPKISTRARPKMKVWNADELRRFFELIEGHDLYTAFYVKVNTGMRRGEVLGLTWRVVDFDNARLSVTQTVTAPDYQLKVSDVKSAHSLRTIDLDQRTVAVLRSWRKRQLEIYMQTGVRTDDSGFVFAKPNGDPLHPDFFSQTFERLIAKMDLPRIRFHDLRHTHATLLLKEGVPPKVVSERLGHASVAFTMQVYQHVLPGMQADAAATFGELVFNQLRPH
jgi:integrase